MSLAGCEDKTTTATQTQASEAPASTSSARAPIDVGGPAKVQIRGADVLLDGKRVAGTGDVDDEMGPGQITKLSKMLRRRRNALKPGDTFDDRVLIEAEPDTTAKAFNAVFRSCAYRGFVHARVSLGADHVDVQALVGPERPPKPDAGAPLPREMRVLIASAHTTLLTVEQPNPKTGAPSLRLV